MPSRSSRLIRAPFVVAWCLVLLVFGVTLHADYRESYRKGIAAVDARQWADVARYMQEAIAEQPREGDRVKIYGNRWELYIPHYYLGLARREMDDCAAAVSAWKTSEQQGFISTQPGEFAVLQRGLRTCGAQLAASARATRPEPSRPPPAAAPRAPAPQPFREVSPSGSRDVVIADLRQTTATIVLDPSLDGRVFIRNERHELVVELYKPRGSRVELGLDPGVYEVRVERPGTAWSATSEIADGERFELTMDQFTPTRPEPARRPGEGPPSFAVAGRNRLELRVAMWRASGGLAPIPGVASQAESTDLLAGLQYTRFVREDLGVTLSANVLPADAWTTTTRAGVFSGSNEVIALPLGVRWDPWPGDSRTRPVKPFLAAGIGPVIGSSVGSEGAPISAMSGATRTATVGGVMGGGVDVMLGRSWSLGVSGGYHWMADFPKPVGGRSNYSGFDVGVTVGWLFGRGYGRQSDR